MGLPARALVETVMVPSESLPTSSSPGVNEATANVILPYLGLSMPKGFIGLIGDKSLERSFVIARETAQGKVWFSPSRFTCLLVRGWLVADPLFTTDRIVVFVSARHGFQIPTGVDLVLTPLSAYEDAVTENMDKLAEHRPVSHAS